MNDEHAHEPPASTGAGAGAGAGDGDHDRFREWLALALYDELDATEAALLSQHLARCADCRAEQRELAAGLGTLRSAPAAAAGTAAAAAALAGVPGSDDAPPGWEAALRTALHAETAAAPAAPAAPVLPLARATLLAAAAFAAGLLVAALLAAPTPGESAAGPPVAVAPRAFSLPEPPPPPLPRAHRSLPGLGLLLAR
jgi:anti-sigma factor RsiW